jgi:CobQ/CobB/MinD/ParA family nucleotide binding protein
MSTVHLALQGKGGVGKSYVAALIAQHQRESGKEVVCVDTDPVNATFSEYRAFEARRLALMEGARINERRFDELMELILATDAVVIVDNGASAFLALSNYLIENAAIGVLAEAGKPITVHSVVTGGQALLDTLTGLQQLAAQFSDRAEIVVWLNEYFGDIIAEGKGFEQMKVYETYKARIRGLIRLYRQSADTFGKDVERMLAERLTFDEAMASPAFSLMAKQRLKMVKRGLFKQMDLVL